MLSSVVVHRAGLSCVLKVSLNMLLTVVFALHKPLNRESMLTRTQLEALLD